jgi:hypothetical protein
VALRHFHRPYYKICPLWFLVDEGLCLLSSTYGECTVDTVVYVIRVTRA